MDPVGEGNPPKQMRMDEASTAANISVTEVEGLEEWIKMIRKECDIKGNSKTTKREDDLRLPVSQGQWLCIQLSKNILMKQELKM